MSNTQTPTPQTQPARPEKPRATPGDFQVEADAYNAKAADIKASIVAEHERHAAHLREYEVQTEDLTRDRNALIADATRHGVTTKHARDVLMKA